MTTITKSYVEHAKVLAEVLGIFRRRNAIRHDLWRVHGFREAVRNVKAKADRADTMMEGIQDGVYRESDLPQIFAELEDDLKDLVNYGVFALRCLREDPRFPARLNTEHNSEASDGQ